MTFQMTKRTKGIMYIISAAFFFALMNMFVNMSGELPVLQKSFFRNLIALIVSFSILVKNKHGFKYKKGNFKLLLIRSAVGTVGILGNFYAVSNMELLADASLLSKLSPFMAIIFSFLFLKEKVKFYQLFAVVAAFVGSLFVIKPGFSSDIFPAIFGVVGAMGAGGAYTAVRALSVKGERGPIIVFFFSAFSCIVTLPFLIFGYVSMTLEQMLCLLMAGIAASGGQFSVTAAYSNAPAKQISVYDYSQVIFSAILGYTFLGNALPDKYSLIGYFIICVVSVIMFVYDKKSETKASLN